MSQPQTPPPLAPGYGPNFKTMLKAAKNGDLALVSMLTKEGEPRAAVCAMQRNADGTITPIPFAVMVWDNPFEMFQAPSPDA